MKDPVTSLSLEWGQDFEISGNGGIQTSSGREQIRQRVIRSILTNPAMTLADNTPVPAEYIFEPDFGVGARALIGEPELENFAAELTQKVRQAVLSDQDVDAAKPPIIKVYLYEDGTVAVTIDAFTTNHEPIGMIFETTR